MLGALPRGTADAAMRMLFPEPNPYLEDPAGWALKRGVAKHLWSKQVEVLESVRDNRYTAVPSAHDMGKSFDAAAAVAWWIDVHDPGTAFAVTTAPTTKQVEAILWREIGRARRAGDLAGRITLDAQWYLSIGGEDELVAYGRKPQDLTSPEEAASAFQGIHARYVLVVLDEASGIPLWLWNAVDTLVTNEHSRVLAIGNPDDPASQFERVCRPGSGWNTIWIDGLDSPNFTDEPVPDELRDVLLSPIWVEERKRRWGESSALYVSKVRGRFPEVSDEMLITPAMVRRAHQTDLAGEAAKAPWEGRYGFDIARLGSDHTVGYLNQAGRARLMYDKHRQTTDVTTGDIAAELREHDARTAVVDSVGVGAGVYDGLRGQGLSVEAFEAGGKALRPERFVNRRAESWWALRRALEQGEVDLDPDDDELASQLQSIKWWRDTRGRVVIESKDDMRKRGMPSPDRADAVMQSFVRQSVLVLDDPPSQPATDEATREALSRNWQETEW
jgi:hypothetical protein